MSFCCGQAYDGASNMSGAVRGAAAVIAQDHPLALYCHCRSHVLNLALVKSCTTVRSISKSLRIAGLFNLSLKILIVKMRYQLL